MDDVADERPSAVERLAAAMGRPVPPPLTEEERRALEAKLARADAQAQEFYRRVMVR